MHAERAKQAKELTFSADLPLHVAPVQPHGHTQLQESISSVPPFLHSSQLHAETRTTTTNSYIKIL